MNHPDDPRDEELFAALLPALDKDAAPPDREVLARLRAQSAEAFSQAPSQPLPLRERKRSMFARAVRWLGAAAAAVVLFGLAWHYGPGRPADAFANVLENVEGADTVHLRVRYDGGAREVEFWHTNRPKRSRWDDAAGQYRIADGKNYWVVNEKANEARRVSPPPDASRPVARLLDLLGLPENRAALLDARPAERIRDGDVDLLVYRVAVPAPGGTVQVDAAVFAGTRRLRSLKTRCEKDGKVVPLGELTVVAYDEPIGSQKFAVADTLTEDGRIGKVADVQGVVGVKPVMHERWTPVRPGLVLRPGDWVRTDARGANAAALHLVKRTGVVLGPKTLAELIGPKRIRISEGEVEITAPAAAVELLGPDGKKVSVKGRQFFRVEKERLVPVDRAPAWALAFRGATTNEALGSLVALVDGRNVPLTVGYHKVSVDVRDQIARTVVEESFVNHTDNVLEGVFHFPLPQDASISGFGMWIGDNLVEADVVERQRAREIYETFLRERRDPALLEWSGGNIFKARVFPIPAHSEKRVKITYTQVLPLQGGRYRYGYALQSELLQQHPLRELSIDVKVHSALPLKSVASPTHPARTEKTAHSAHVEFTAQEYTPTRDFEVVVELDSRQADTVLIPHRRGDDGYFMLQLTPPGSATDWQRPLLPDGEPLHLIVLADTSASIDAAQRATQATFIASLLSALSPKDTFNLGTCDVGCDWAFTQPAPADARNVEAARDYLAKRTSLGWTNLDLAFAEALRRCGPRTHVIYVGDGIVTAGDADPVAFTKRLRRLYQGHRGVFHAVTLGNSYEPGVMKAIASLGGGSLRKITGEQGPQTVALDLLGEIARPGLRDLKVEFKGLKVARVYPEELPNVPAGSQQIVLGRYLPEGQDQAGEVIVTGTQGGKPVRFSARVALQDAEKGNSFIPRLWARLHLDALLDQGNSAAIRDEIIALSEEYQIITPYTSLLVLETDADRERFGVKRRFRMRDGEKFFAAGRDRATFELKQKQMKKAGEWRTALRRSVLRQLAGLGRNPRLFQPHLRYRDYTRTGRLHWNAGYEMEALDLYQLQVYPVGDLQMRLSDAKSPLPGERRGGAVNEYLVDNFTGDGEVPLGEAPALESDEVGGKRGEMFRDLEGGEGLEATGEGREEWEAAPRRLARDASLVYEPFPESGLPYGGPQGILDGTANTLVVLGEYAGVAGTYDGRYARARGPRYGEWLDTLFPTLRPVPGKAKAPKSSWPAAARELAQSLLRTGQLARMTGGVEIVRRSEWFDARWAEPTSRSRQVELFSAKSWLTRSAIDGGQTLISWCDEREYGVFSEAFRLGRLRAAKPGDVQPPPLGLGDDSLTSLEASNPHLTAAVEPQGKDRALLVLRNPTAPHYDMRVLIDTARHVILSFEHRHRGKVTEVTRYDDFVEVAGSWWARRVERTDGDGKRLSLSTQTVRPLTPQELEGRVRKELAGREQVQFLRLPLPGVRAAKKALAAGKAGFEEQFVLLLHFSATQQWARVLDHLGQAEKLAAGKPGLRWLRSALLYDSRRHEELRKRYLEDAARLAGKEAPPRDAYYLAEYVIGQSSRVLQANEMLALLDTLRPLYQRQPAPVRGAKRWLHYRVTYLNQTGRKEEALRTLRQLATDYPRDYGLQQEYAQALAAAGAYPDAYAWLTRALGKGSQWLDYEEESLRSLYAQLLRQEGRYPDLVNYLAAWVKQEPTRRSAYEQYLSALIKTDRVEQAEALAGQWLKEGQVPGELPASAEARLQAAVYLMLGNGYDLHTNQIEERWLAPLARAALFFARHETQASVAEQIMGRSTFYHTDEGRRLLAKVVAILAAEIDKLPAEQVQRFVYLARSEEVEPGTSKKIADGLLRRWANEASGEIKHTLGHALVNYLSSHAADEVLPFLRLQYHKGPARYRVAYASQLFEHLLTQPWTAQGEEEAFTLLGKMSDADDAGVRLFTEVAALHRLTDTMLEARYAARMKTVEHPEKLTRIELRKKQAEARRLAREGFADRLRQEAAKDGKALAPWLTAERLYLDVSLDRNLKQAAAESWEFVGGEPPQRPKAGAEPSLERGLREVLRQRYLTTLMNLAARKGAEPAAAERLLKYLARGVTADPEDGRWKLLKYRLLVALDRPKGLEQELRRWVGQDEADSRWRVALGYLLAEQGQVAEAIRQFEAVEVDDELSPAAYRTLADWYLVVNDRARHDRAAAAVYQTASEYALNRAIYARLNPWQRRDGHLPTELDPEILRLFATLFAKSSAPQNYLSPLQQFYQACHDFRLLAVLADSVVGHSAARVYPFVQGMRWTLEEVRDEATADELVRRIGEARERARTAVDRRALDLLEVLVERRAAEVQNQPGPHIAKALAALQRAFKHDWSPGEPRLMADFLAGLGRITPAALAAEQLRQAKALHDKAARGTPDRLHIAHQYANTLRSYDRTAEAIDVLGAALQEFQEANKGVLPVSANDALASYVTYLEGAGHFARGENYLFAQLRHPAHQQQRLWLTQRLYQLYHVALQNGGGVSLGSGRTLYRALDRKIQGDLANADDNHRSWLIDLLCRVYRTAQAKRLPNVAADLRAFAFKALPPLLKWQTNSYRGLVSNVAQTLHDLAGPRDGIAFLLDRIEAEPRWLRYNNQDGWASHGSTLAYWRTQAKDLGDDLEGRLLAAVLTELRRDLATRTNRNRTGYSQRIAHYWTEKEADFARAAEDVLAKREQSGPSVQYIAEYFFWGLLHRNRAIEVLFAGHKRKLLDEAGRAQLVDYLHHQLRFGESIALLRPLVERRPENLRYRVLLMHAYFRTSKKVELLALLKATDAFFHQKGRWAENVMAGLAHSCLENELFEQSVAYFKEAIPLHERTRPRRGVGDGTLADYYMGLARAYAGLRKTAEAVEAAGGAIVAWGRQHTDRARALETLKDVLVHSPDLDGFVAHFDKQKQDSAIVRKALGEAYHARGELARAVRQLELAAELQPNDAAIFKLLISYLDQVGDKEGAIRQQLRAAQASRRDIQLYHDLGRRYDAAGRPQEAERAYTSVVEMLPAESESHALLAEVRQRQNRWPEAVAQWEHVARIRALEPTGLLKLAAAQIHQKQWDRAEETLRRLNERTWPARFGDVHGQVRTLLAQVAEGRGR
jgi:predicted Zn-dependent protease